MQNQIWSRRGVAVIGWISALLSLNYIRFIFAKDATRLLTVHQSIVDRIAPSPYAYRLLVPEAVNLFALGLHHFIHSFHGCLIVGYVIVIAFGITGSIVCLYCLFREEFTEVVSLAGIVLVSFSMLGAFQEIQPWSLLDPGLFAIGLILFRNGHKGWLIPLVAIATLNRETALFLVIVLVASRYKNLRKVSGWIWPTVYFAVWAAVYGGVRLFVGDRPHEYPISVYLPYNLRPTELAFASLKWLIFLGPFWFLYFKGLRKNVEDSWVSSLLPLVLFCMIAAPYAVWDETRLLTPFYCVIIPVVLRQLAINVPARKSYL